MFDNTEAEDIEMARFVAEAIDGGITRQSRTAGRSMNLIALAAILALVRWAQAHPHNSDPSVGRH